VVKIKEERILATEEQVRRTLFGVKHPESGHGIVELGMVKDIKVDGEQVSFTIALPFLDVPVKDQIVNKARKAIEELEGVKKITVEVAEMTQKERVNFMTLQEGRTGAAQQFNQIERVIAVMSGKGGVVLVTSPQELAGMVVRKAARMAQQMSAPILGLVENMSYVVCPNCGRRIELFGSSKAETTAGVLGIPLLGKLPVDPIISRLCDEGRIEEYPVENFAPIADELMNMIERSKARLKV
jgi:Mrp family chromosome partitioning ATPase